MKKRRKRSNDRILSSVMYLHHAYSMTYFASTASSTNECSSTLIGLRRVHDEQKRETKLSARVSHLTAFLDTHNVSLKTEE